MEEETSKGREQGLAGSEEGKHQSSARLLCGVHLRERSTGEDSKGPQQQLQSKNVGMD